MVSRRLLVAIILVAVAALGGAAADAPRSRDFELTYSVRVGELPAGAHRVEVWLPYPAGDGNQEVTVAEIASPYPYTVSREPRFGNSILHLAATDPGQRELAIEMRIRVRRREYLRHDYARAGGTAAASPGPAAATSASPSPPPPAPTPAIPPTPPTEQMAAWLQPDRLVPLDDRIRALAATITRGRRGDLEKARAIYDYVVDTMSYDKTGSGWGNGDIYWACDAKRGNCTDFHALFIGLARAVGIPAKFEIGFPLPAAHGQGEIGGYHCWAEFHLTGYGWVPVDASEARKNPALRGYFFGALDENRVQFTVGRDLLLVPRQAAAPLNYFIYPHVEVDGQPFARVSRKFLYQDRGEPASARGGAGAR
jgi:transglutaminase-like putative cysteine protease